METGELLLAPSGARLYLFSGALRWIERLSQLRERAEAVTTHFMREDGTEAEMAQAPAVAWLTKELGPRLKRIDTQGATLLRAGDDPIKIRRAIKAPFLDCSPLEERGLAEIALDLDAAPSIHRDAIAVTPRASLAASARETLGHLPPRRALL